MEKLAESCAALTLVKGKVIRHLESQDSKGNVIPVPDFPKLPPLEGKFTVTPDINCETYYATKEDDPVHWVLMNGHHEKEHAEYGNKMIQEWKKVLEDRGDVVESVLNYPTKKEFAATFKELFWTLLKVPGVVGICVICQGDKDGSWINFNPKDTSETFGVKDLKECLSFGSRSTESSYAREIIVVADSPHSSSLGVSLFLAFSHEETQVPPALLFLGYSGKFTKNFSVNFALDAMRKKRKLSLRTMDFDEAADDDGAIDDHAAVKIAQDIKLTKDSVTPWYFLFVPSYVCFIPGHRTIYAI